MWGFVESFKDRYTAPGYLTVSSQCESALWKWPVSLFVEVDSVTSKKMSRGAALNHLESLLDYLESEENSLLSDKCEYSL
jgi:hypothetical protein